jgi:HlyD family secretion protein
MNLNKEKISGKISKVSELLYNNAGTDPLDFSPAIIRLQEKLPTPLGRAVLKAVGVLFCGLLLWASFGRLDIVAVADGKLVPKTYLKIVQPAEQGIVKEILVSEGEPVKKGQVLMRMDAAVSDAQGRELLSEYHRLRLGLRRIDAELGGKSLSMEKDGPADIYSQVLAQYNANRRALESSLDEQRSALEKAIQEMGAAREIRIKLERILPHYREQAKAYEELGRDGYVARLEATDKQRERIEKEQDLKSQEYIIRSNQAIIAQTRKKIAQITAEYQRRLNAERSETARQFEKALQELAKQQHQKDLLELKAPQNGVVKDLATHTAGTVVNPGTILMTLVPLDESLQAEVWVTNEDIGFVRPGQKVKLKISAFTFQKYGMIDGLVEKVGADSSDNRGQGSALEQNSDTSGKAASKLYYKTMVSLASQRLAADGKNYKLAPGMQVAAEIKLGTRTVLEYLFSPVTKAFHEAGRER